MHTVILRTEYCKYVVAILNSSFVNFMENQLAHVIRVRLPIPKISSSNFNMVNMFRTKLYLRQT